MLVGARPRWVPGAAAAAPRSKRRSCGSRRIRRLLSSGSRTGARPLLSPLGGDEGWDAPRGAALSPSCPRWLPLALAFLRLATFPPPPRASLGPLLSFGFFFLLSPVFTTTNDFTQDLFPLPPPCVPEASLPDLHSRGQSPITSSQRRTNLPI